MECIRREREAQEGKERGGGERATAHFRFWVATEFILYRVVTWVLVSRQRLVRVGRLSCRDLMF